MFICICVYVLCMCVCLYVCMYVYVCVCMHAYVCVCMGVCMYVVVSVLPLGRFLASMFSILSCFPPYSLIPHTTLLSETHFAYPIVFFPLVFSPSSDPLSPPLAGDRGSAIYSSEYMADPVFLPSPDHKASFFLYQL